jgi:hypothetical protein
LVCALRKVAAREQLDLRRDLRADESRDYVATVLECPSGPDTLDGGPWSPQNEVLRTASPEPDELTDGVEGVFVSGQSSERKVQDIVQRDFGDRTVVTICHGGMRLQPDLLAVVCRTLLNPIDSQACCAAEIGHPVLIVVTTGDLCGMADSRTSRPFERSSEAITGHSFCQADSCP